MAKEKNIPINIFSKIRKSKNGLLASIIRHKKIIGGIAVVALLVLGSGILRAKNSNVQSTKPKSTVINVDKSFDFSALNNQGKPVASKIRLKIATVEKTNQVNVKDQTFTAKNNKIFLIVGLELKNDATLPYNILPGDLVRLTYNGDEENKYAPDLHNNMVTVAPISTKIDRVGFVVPENAKDFKLYVGEIEGKKEVVNINLPS